LFPDVINSPSDVYKFEVFEKKGNFITNKIIKSKIVYLVNSQFDKKLKNKIVVIQSADPGYDWIFGYKISGLITQYGGANSHMAIRCAELNIPAAIGVGEDIFSNLKNSDKVFLDCKNKQIIYD
ncbi:PEP-utilizing enzyme, partial [Candidatus Pelagibacter sp.]|nr:PEP-utilizing enzyme [Candidatus Pelagibacter sp.]